MNTSDKKNRISLCMIVKNEAQNLPRCLNSVKEAVDEIIIVDTGSSDHTCQIARDAGAAVCSFLWNNNFSDARNVSLEMASGDWILFLDADEELPTESCSVLRRLICEDSIDGYFVKIINHIGKNAWVETCPDLVFRLFKNQPEYRFHGAIHEQIAGVILERNPKASFRTAEDFVVLHYGYLDDQITEKNKKDRNLKLIEAELLQRPDSCLLRFHYGVELFRAARYEDAAVELTKAANGTDPNTIYFPKILRYIVLAHNAAGQLTLALDAAMLGLRFFPNYADLYYYAGIVHLDLKQYRLAREYFEKAVSMPVQPAQYASFAGVRGFRAYYYLGEISKMFLNYEEGLRFYIASIKDNPNFSPAMESMIRILNPRKNPEYTRECIEKVCEFCTPQANQMIAEIYMQQGAYALALQYYEKSFDLPSIRLRKAICLIQEHRFLEALRLLETCIVYNELFSLVKLNELIIFWLEGKTRKVRTLLASLLSLGLPQDTVDILRLIGEQRMKKENLPVVLEKEGMQLFLDILFRLLYMGETEKAMHLLNRISPESVEPHIINITQTFYDYGDVEHAEALLRNHAAQQGTAYCLLADICREKGDFFEAEQYYRYAIELSPDAPQHYVKLIEMYDERRKQILSAAVERYPETEVFKKLIMEGSSAI